MKVLFIPDVHWCQYSSILRSRGEKYSTRLENLIVSVNWAELFAWEHGCNAIIYGGDFFDSSQLNSEEISALQCVQWAPISHVFIKGNHEVNVSTLEYSTSDIFKLCPNAMVCGEPEHYFIEGENVEFCFLPYILEKDRKPLAEYFPPKTINRIIFSHNDIKNIQYGPFLSTEGFAVEDIEANCDLFINGHIHHCYRVGSKIINAGNLTGQNFTEDASKFDHCIQLIDTNTLHVDFYCNPHALNFYKLDYTHINDEETFLYGLEKLKNYSVLTIKVNSHFAALARQTLSQINKTRIVEYRLIIEPDITIHEDSPSIVSNSVDHLKQFETYVLTNIGDTNVIREELLNVIR